MYCLLHVACCLLPIAFCLLPLAYCLLPLASCLLPIACCLLPIAYWSFQAEDEMMAAESIGFAQHLAQQAASSSSAGALSDEDAAARVRDAVKALAWQ